jgi:hypothetical protein
MFRNHTQRLKRMALRFIPERPSLDNEILIVNNAMQVVRARRVENGRQVRRPLPEPVTVEQYKSLARSDPQ